MLVLMNPIVTTSLNTFIDCEIPRPIFLGIRSGYQRLVTKRWHCLPPMFSHFLLTLYGD
jgi:hypothetical protein